VLFVSVPSVEKCFANLLLAVYPNALGGPGLPAKEKLYAKLIAMTMTIVLKINACRIRGQEQGPDYEQDNRKCDGT